MAFSDPGEGDQEPRVQKRDPFEVLGVPPTASRKEITEAYRCLAQRHHPDRHLDSSPRRRSRAERRMRELNEAYQEAKSRPPPPVYRGTNTVPNAALWLGTAPGTWARTARRSSAVTEEERRQSLAQIAEAATEHDARARVAREARLQADRQAGAGQARTRPKSNVARGAGPMKVLAGLGQALATSQMRCTGCRSLQTLPAGWKKRLHDTDYICSACQRVLLAR
ncbi:MAG TPA: J domain-containing protein [Acidimicrobiales bacterium]|nr:J domain-containing protein [Acidimicrobiales bacterium]